MSKLAEKYELIQELQRSILQLQGLSKPALGRVTSTGLSIFEQAFPDKTFPTSAVHEFLSVAPENAAATNGFIAGLLAQLIPDKSMCIWIGTKRTLFPHALKFFGIEPERFIFVDLQKRQDALWVIEEALKCKVLGAVIGELQGLSFIESRRLQLAVEQSHVTGFIHRHQAREENTVACVTRWKIEPAISETHDMPGIGFPKWNVELTKVRNGRPGSWQIEWAHNGFRQVHKNNIGVIDIRRRKTG